MPSLVLAVLPLLLVSTPDLPPPATDAPASGLSAAVGAAVALGALGAGGALWATGSDSTTRNGGVVLVTSGLALAPLVSHAIDGEWKRGLAFFAIPAAAGLAADLILLDNNDLLTQGQATSRSFFVLFMSLELAASAVGVFDSLFSHDRKQVVLTPLALPRGAGLAIAGVL